MTDSVQQAADSEEPSRSGTPGSIPAEIVREQFSRLRAEIMEARREGEKWRTIAEERERALERADITIQAFANALSAGRPIEVGSSTSPTLIRSQPESSGGLEIVRATSDEETRAPATSDPRRDPIDSGGLLTSESSTSTAPPGYDEAVAIPPHIREEASRYAETFHAISEFREEVERPRRWWQVWR